MENASKAIIMAGAVLVAIILISIGVFLWRDYAGFSEQKAQDLRNQQINEFNVKFQKYNFNENGKNEDSKNYATAQDVRTIVNLAKDYNSKYEEELIKVTYSGKSPSGSSSGIINWTDENWAEFLNTSNSEQSKFKIESTSSYESDIISKIQIMKVIL